MSALSHSAYDYIPAGIDVPDLYASEQQGDAALALIKLFTPDASWMWYITEISREDHDLCFGLVDGHFVEMGYFRLSELRTVRGPLGLRIERDPYWEPKTLGEIRRRLNRGLDA